MAPVIAVMAWIMKDCAKQPGSREVQIGQRIIYQMAGKETLRKAGFYDEYPTAKPSDFVRFVSSGGGEKLWPPVEGTAGNDRAVDVPSSRQSSSNRVLKPRKLTFSARERTNPDQPQVVYYGDDEKGKIIVEGYDPGKEKPVYTYDFDFPTDAGEIPLK